MANQSANQPTGTIINSNKQVNMYNNQQNATIHKDNSKDFFFVCDYTFTTTIKKLTTFSLIVT